jgi:hypothetical protein
VEPTQEDLDFAEKSLRSALYEVIAEQHTAELAKKDAQIASLWRRIEADETALNEMIGLEQADLRYYREMLLWARDHFKGHPAALDPKWLRVVARVTAEEVTLQGLVASGMNIVKGLLDRYRANRDA